MENSNIIQARNNFIRDVIKDGVKYLGRIDKEELSEEALVFFEKKKTGKEILIEYHMFEIKSLPVVNQFRLV